MIFICNGGHLQSLRDYSLALDAPVKLGPDGVPAHADVHFTDRNDGTEQLDAAARLSANFSRFNLAPAVHYRGSWAKTAGSLAGANSPLKSWAAAISATSACAARPHSTSRLGALPNGRAGGLLVGDRECRLGGRRSPMRRRRIAAARGCPTSADSARFAVALTGEAATDGSVAVGAQPQFLARSGAWLRPVAAAAGPGRIGPRDWSIATSTTMASAIRRAD